MPIRSPIKIALVRMLVAIAAGSIFGCGVAGEFPNPAANRKVAGMEKYEYLACDGGPHLVIPTRLLPAWHGSRINLTNPLDPATDYGRACAIKGKFALITVGSGKALVLADPPMSTWTRISDGGQLAIVVLNGWGDMNLDGLVDRALADLPADKMTDTGERWSIEGSELTHLYAGDEAAKSVYGVYSMPVESSTYRILEGRHRPGGRDDVSIYRLVPDISEKE